MSFDYTKSAASATKLLTKFGRTVVRTATTAGTYVPGGTVTGATTANTNRIAAFFDYGDQGRSGEQYVRGSLVQKGDKQMLLDPNGAAELTDLYTVGSDVYTVVSIGEVNPAGTVVLFDIHVRRS